MARGRCPPLETAQLCGSFIRASLQRILGSTGDRTIVRRYRSIIPNNYSENSFESTAQLFGIRLVRTYVRWLGCSHSKGSKGSKAASNTTQVNKATAVIKATGDLSFFTNRVSITATTATTATTAATAPSTAAATASSAAAASSLCCSAAEEFHYLHCCPYPESSPLLKSSRQFNLECNKKAERFLTTPCWLPIGYDVIPNNRSEHLKESPAHLFGAYSRAYRTIVRNIRRNLPYNRSETSRRTNIRPSLHPTGNRPHLQSTCISPTRRLSSALIMCHRYMQG